LILTNENAVKSVTEKAKGGVGHVSHLHFINAKNRPDSTRVAMAAINTIPVGSSLGFHIHDNDEEVYLILEGQGLYTDSNRQQYPVKTGDFTLARQGEGHALLNTGETPLVFAAVIVDSGK
jgi:mannose-6-phosphate isomerase-like protein (cupin superfamily)